VDERTLVGGRTVGAVRVGESVRKPSQPWTPAVHAVLRHLESAGLDGAPRSGGVDEHGRQVLSFLTGETVGEQRPWPAWVWADATLAQVGAWLRRLHDVTTTFRPPEGAVWFAGQSWRPDLIIGHHDAAPYNAVWRDGRLVGFADWDTAGPSRPSASPGSTTARGAWTSCWTRTDTTGTGSRSGERSPTGLE
jgi:hypothetical protein